MVLERKHVEAAIERIKAEGLPEGNRESTRWDLIDPKSGQRFPPKAILRWAREKSGQTIDNLPGGGWPTNNPLRKLGFEIVPKNESNEVDTGIAEDISNVKNSKFDATTKAQLIDARLGQGKFRNALMDRWQECCPITKCTVAAVLRASHIKPWRDSTNAERLDPANGLLLSASIDALFDRALLTFDSDGAMKVAKEVSSIQLDRLGVPSNVKITIPENSQVFIKQHQAEFHTKNGQSYYRR
ncbi:HNH endonuclease signature motif containing protein [Novosphingobium sp.]|uniref:HNH endonuclease n=1 Tax=Novosphingobium sp. TaxID=1874826 RepID=UPI0025CDC1B4|nr:HNH endonuclease signature motif containing protein [Novosphingobium sp.]